jgi:hypothetical protein
MKNFRFLTYTSIAASLMLTACSSDSPEPNDGGSASNSYGTSYLAVNINLPTTDGTRAEDNTYDDGDAAEYAVNSATLYVYQLDKNATTRNEEFVDMVDLTLSGENNSDQGITTTQTSVAQLHFKPNKDYNYYALVLINKKSNNNKLPNHYQYFRDWYNSVWTDGNGYKMMVDQDESGNYKNFYMANAMYHSTTASSEGVSADGSSAYITTNPLVLIDYSQFRNTEGDALASTGISINVERGVAKVTFQEASSKNYWQSGVEESNISWDNAESISGGKIVFLNWMVSNTNGSSYPVGTIGELAADGSLVAGNSLNTDEIKALINGSDFTGNSRRLNWAYTPRYFMDGTTAKPASDLEVGLVPDAVNLKFSDRRYMLEHTMRYSDMIKGLGTRVILKAKYQPTGLTLSNDGTFYELSSRLYSDATLLELVNNNLPTGVTALTASDVDFSKIPLKYSMFTTDVLKTLTAEQVATVNSNLGITNDDHGVARYDKGYCYYYAYIRHLSDNVSGVKWEGGEYTIGHMGRYGVVRNNWYKLEIQSVSKHGTPDVPDVDEDEQIDDTGSYIRINVSTNAWARHSHSVIL